MNRESLREKLHFQITAPSHVPLHVSQSEVILLLQSLRTDIMGNPMREVSPGVWEVAVWPSNHPKVTHKATGGVYSHIGQAILQTSKPLEDMAHVQIYQGTDGRYWARETQEFGEKFK